MKIEEHEKAYEEHLRNIKRAIDEGLEENQRNIGYNISQGAVELLAIYFHKLNLLQGSGDQLDHRIFKSQNLIAKKIPPEFPQRNEILKLMKNMETERNAICYGNRKTKERITNVVLHFQNLRRIINKNLKNVEKK
jgi:hypothetical protein